METEVELGDSKEILGFRHKWTFDEMYTSFAVEGLDANGDGLYSEEELKPLAKTNVEALKAAYPADSVRLYVVGWRRIGPRFSGIVSLDDVPIARGLVVGGEFPAAFRMKRAGKSGGCSERRIR